MIPLIAALSVLMGLSLGLLGGGGSVLAVPILHYVAGVEAKSAIATSLLVVGATSIACTAQHARNGHVRWKTGAAFGGFAMAGAYAGGFAAKLFSGETLLALFALMMIAAGVAMLRPREETSGTRPPAALWKVAAQGLGVGAATGLVGAGGGFMVVPALVLLGGLDMRSAVGTSAMVISMNSLAGFAGHAAHVEIDLSLAGLVVAFAVLGSVLGARWVQKIDPSRLRRVFGVFVLVVAAVMLYQQAPRALVQAVLVERWPFWAGGLGIGLFVLVFLAATRQALGVSTGLEDACALAFDEKARRSWRLPFMIGIAGGGALSAALAGALAPTLSMGTFDLLVGSSLAVKAAVFTGGGVLIGFGSRLAGGCTSGHGIVGMAQLARSSLLATAAFMVAGFAVTQLLVHTLGGTP